jgi:hypothetical protein
LAQDFTPGQSYFGTNDYAEYRAGNLPIIIALPHGGEFRPDEIPNRSCSGCITSNDSFTQELGIQLYEAIKEQTGCYPHLIINKLHRSKMDANRDINEAALGNQLAEGAWQDFQQFIDTAKFQVNQVFGKGLFLDLHGHAHDLQRIEWGYLLSGSDLQLSDDQLNSNTLVKESSIKNLVKDNLTQLSHSELLRGAASLGALLEKEQFEGVPTPQTPFPEDDEPYFRGGYNTRRHGSFNSGSIDGIQIECNRDIRFNENNRERFAKRLAKNLIEYLNLHYFDEPLQASCLFTDTEESFSNDIEIFPNPFDTEIYIRGSVLPDRVELYDMFGRLVTRRTGKTLDRLSFAHLNNGLYLLVLSDGNKIIGRKRLVKGGR